MFLTIEPHQYNPQFVMFSEKTKNNVLSGGDFYRIYYSDEECILNGVHIRLALRNITIEKYFNKIKCCFSRRRILCVSTPKGRIPNSSPASIRVSQRYSP